MPEPFFAPPEFTVFFDRVIGEGSFGQVFFGSLTEAKTPICVKVTRNAADQSFEKEFALLAKLKGKDAIIQTFGYQDVGSYRCIVLERADGSLEGLLNLPRHSLGLPTSVVLDLVGDLAKALTVLTDLKIAHRDIKPMNILYFTREPRKTWERYNFKLCDFGEGRTVQDMMASFTTIGGTVIFMAPQTLARHLNMPGSHKLNAERSDLWSLGVTLFRCVTGRFPFFPQPYSDRELLRILEERPSGKAVEFHNGEYEEDVQSMVHPKWFLDVMTIMIQYLLKQTHSKGLAFMMTELSKLHSRVIYNVRKNVFYVAHPQISENHVLFSTNWSVNNDFLDVDTNDRGVCVLNESDEIYFSVVDASKCNSQMTSKRQDDGKCIRQRQEFTLAEVNSVPGQFLIVCERPMDRMRNAPPAVSLKELEQIDEHFASRSLAYCTAVVYYDLLAFQAFINYIHRVSKTIESQRMQAIKRLGESLIRGKNRTPNAELRSRAVETFHNRKPEPFWMHEQMKKAIVMVRNFMQKLDGHDEKQGFVRPTDAHKKRQELVAMTKFIASVQRQLQEAMVGNCHRMMSSLRRIVEFNELADNLEAHYAGRPLPHTFAAVAHTMKKNDMRYEPPPGNLQGNVARPNLLLDVNDNADEDVIYSTFLPISTPEPKLGKPQGKTSPKESKCRIS